MTHVLKRIDGTSVLVNDELVADLEATDVDSDQTSIKLKDGSELVVDAVYDDLFQRFGGLCV